MMIRYRVLAFVLFSLAIVLQITLSNPTMMKGFWVSIPALVAAVISFFLSRQDVHRDDMRIDLAMTFITFIFAVVTGAPTFSYWY